MMKDFNLFVGKLWIRDGNLSTLNCRYYGFECNFEANGEIEKITDKMKLHALAEHRIDFTKKFLSQEILRKNS